MIKNYFKIAWRNLWKHRTFSIIIVAGMAVAFAAAILLSVTAYDELTFDHFHDNRDHLYQLYNEEFRVNGVERGSAMPAPLTPALKQDYPQIVRISRYGSGAGELVRYKEKELDLTTDAVDPDFLDMFSFPAVAGNKKEPLKELTDVAITEKCAKNLFGTEDQVGKTDTRQQSQHAYDQRLAPELRNQLPAQCTHYLAHADFADAGK